MEEIYIAGLSSFRFYSRSRGDFKDLYFYAVQEAILMYGHIWEFVKQLFSKWGPGTASL